MGTRRTRDPMENGVYPVVTEPIYDGHCDIVTIVSNTEQNTHTHTKRGEGREREYVLPRIFYIPSSSSLSFSFM